MAAQPPPSEVPIPSRAFVLGLADADGRLDAGPLYDAAEAVGFTPTTVRLTLRRLVDAGLMSIDGRGRSAGISLTATGLAERAVDLTWVAARHRVDAGHDPWDGRWYLVGFEIPEAQRGARDALRSAIVDMFAAPLAGGLYVSPWPIRPWLEAVIAHHDLAERVTFIETDSLDVGGRSEPSDVASSVWPLAELEADYDAFVGRWSRLVEAPVLDSAVRVAFQASAEMEQLLRRDPVVPLALSPAPSGVAARSLYRQLLAVLRADPTVASANVFGAYEAAIDRALGRSSSEFWSEAFSSTSVR